MYFFPQKVNYLTENIQRKRNELELYKSIINESMTFLRNKINENKQKHDLVSEMNVQVAAMVEDTLKREQEFYESDTHDKLKVPPFCLVKRLER
jgi:CRISPR/Cas system CMR subunit Cmr6 (Cas7 group RAMP superfamily)